MKTGNSDGDGAVFDATPYLKLFIDKDGRWFQNGAEIVHDSIAMLFRKALERTPDGGYQVRVGRETCRVEVEDAPFIVLRVSESEDGRVMLTLNDQTVEPFDPSSFRIGEGNVPYAQVKEGEFHARFSRPAYYQLARYIQTDDERRFLFVIKGERFPISAPPDAFGGEESPAE